MKTLWQILLAASLACALTAQAKPESRPTGKTKLGATLKGVKLGRDWTRR
jgi:hypothetical protein